MKVNSRRSQSGFAHLGIIIGVVVFIGAVGLIAWRVMDAQKNNSPADSAVQQALANAKCEGADKDICKFYASWKASASFKVNSTMNYGGQATTSMFESADSGKRYHMTTTVNGRPYEVIGIDNAIYTKDTSGTWWKQTIEQGKETDYTGNEHNYDFSDPEAAETEEQKTSYKLLGKEACGNLTCFKYQVVDSANPETTEYIWFDDRDYQMRRMRTEGKDSYSDQTFSYDKISINVPSPVKELGPNQVLNPETGEVITMPDQAAIQKQLDEALNGAQ